MELSTKRKRCTGCTLSKMFLLYIDGLAKMT